MEIRRAESSDLLGIELVQAACPEAAQWPPAHYLAYDCWVALVDGVVAGFVVSRALVDEREILNLAVHPVQRQQGVGETLVCRELESGAHAWFLEVRESNVRARRLYGKLGFVESARRADYYDYPAEDAIVMTKFS